MSNKSADSKSLKTKVEKKSGKARSKKSAAEAHGIRKKKLPSALAKKAPKIKPGDDSEGSATSARDAPVARADDPRMEEPQQGIGIVGVGASAGGLEAFSQLLGALPENFAMPVVLVQHLAADHESMLPSLLRDVSKLPVAQAADGMPLEPAHVYVIPPNSEMEVVGGKLTLFPRAAGPGKFNPIDQFFRSLANYAHHRSIGVVLSGSGSDGANGLREIKAVGGIAFAQKPETAKHDWLPRAAIGTGVVDFIASPEDIAKELVVTSQHPFLTVTMPRKEGDELEIGEDDLRPVLALLRKHHGVDFSRYKTPTIKRRLRRRVVLHKITGIEQYVKLLREDPGEVRRLYQDILIHVTRFFREPASFEALASTAFPEVTKRRIADDPIRVWVPGCSTGEEPYSVAIALLEFLGDDARATPIQIFATDISETAIDQARVGDFPETIVQDLSNERLRRYFMRHDARYRISKSVRDLCVFARQDLTRDPPFSKLDLIVCRNVLIYMDPPLQRRILSVFHYALEQDGFLMLGPAETVGLHGEYFSVVDKKHRLYRKRRLSSPPEPAFPVDYGSRAQAATRPREPAAEPRLSEQVDRVILERYTPPSVTVDSADHIIQTRGRTGAYLELSPGEPTLNVARMAREGLLHELCSALQEAKTRNRKARRERLRVRGSGGFRTIDLEVIPISSPEGAHFLIVFDERSSNSPPPEPTTKSRRSTRTASRSADAARIDQLERELASNREYLQSIIQDLEATTEELQSANEEILSSNEELQCTNEELDTAKEELQSSNEELNTMNEELHTRNEELTRVNSDLLNLLASIDAAIVMVTGDLRVRRFTPAAERVLNLIPSDVGRPIQQINPNIQCPDLEELIQETIDHVTTLTREVQDGEGRWYSLRIRPYKDVENRIDGAVLALFDIDSRRRQEAEVAAARDLAEGVIETTREPLLVLDRELRVKIANQPFCRLFGVQAGDVIGLPVQEVQEVQAGLSGSELAAELGKVLRTRKSTESFQIDRPFPGAGTKRLEIQARRIAAEEDEPRFMLLTFRNVEDT